MATEAALTSEQVTEMMDLYAAGYTQVELAEHFKVCDGSIRYWLHKSGVKTRDNTKLPERIAQEAVPRESVVQREEGTPISAWPA